MEVDVSDSHTNGAQVNGTVDADHTHPTVITLSLKHEKGILRRVLKHLEDLGVNMTHIESRPSQTNPGAEYDFYIDCSLSFEREESLRKQLEGISKNVSIHVNGKDRRSDDIWIPRRIKDLDRFANKIDYFGGDLEPDHPGYNDMKYRERRKFIEQIALNYKQGQPIPRVEYTEEEIKTWGIIFREQTKRYPTHACKEYNHLFPLLVENCGYREDNIPQLQDVSDYLKECTGFQLRPVAGLVSPRQFLSGLAFRVFHSTQYIRHSSKPTYTPEPDICHEMLGHAPLFCDPDFAKFSQELGLASLGAPDEYIKKLSTLYWFTLEFGMCKQDGGIKAYGAGLLSSIEELQYCRSDVPKFKEFNPVEAAVEKFPLRGVQPLYYLADSFNDARQKLIAWAREIPRAYSVSYDPYSQSILLLDNHKNVSRFAGDILNRYRTVENAIERL